MTVGRAQGIESFSVVDNKFRHWTFHKKQYWGSKRWTFVSGSQHVRY